MLPFSTVELLRAVENGDVTARKHPTLPYTIYNYSPETQYRKLWNDVTLNCRGLILDNNFNIVARPWKKFFNLGEVELPMQFTDPVEIMDKVDGSLGILYPVHDPYFHNNLNGWAIATRGSFISEQAQHATQVLEAKYRQDFPNFEKVALDYTFLFEIIYPENRIVLNYDGMDDLILLGAVENETGYYLSPVVASAMLGWNGLVVKTFKYKSITEALGHMDRQNAEGYVIRSHNFMVKLKQPDYLELHRLVTNMTPKTIWEQLKNGRLIKDIVADLPDEFHSMVENIAAPLMNAYTERVAEIIESYWNIHSQVKQAKSIPSRKDWASVFTTYKDSKYYFALLDQRSINELVWNELKPKESDVRSDAD